MAFKGLCSGLLPIAECLFPFAAINDSPRGKDGRRFVNLQLVPCVEMVLLPELQRNRDLPLVRNGDNHGLKSCHSCTEGKPAPRKQRAGLRLSPPAVSVDNQALRHGLLDEKVKLG